MCDTRTPRRAACVPATRSAPRGDARGRGSYLSGHDGGRHARPGSAGTIRTANAVPRADWLSAFWKLKIFSWRLRRLATRLPRRRTVSRLARPWPRPRAARRHYAERARRHDSSHEFRRGLARGLAPGEARRRRDPPRGLHERAGHAQVRPVCRGGTRVTSPEADYSLPPTAPPRVDAGAPAPPSRGPRRATTSRPPRARSPSREPPFAPRVAPASARAPRGVEARFVAHNRRPSSSLPSRPAHASPPLLSLTHPAEIPRRSPFAALRTRPPSVAPSALARWRRRRAPR